MIIHHQNNPFPDSTHWLDYGVRCRCSHIPRSTKYRFFLAFAAETVNFRFWVNVWRIPKVAENVASRGDPASIDILRTEPCRWGYLQTPTVTYFPSLRLRIFICKFYRIQTIRQPTFLLLLCFNGSHFTD